MTTTHDFHLFLQTNSPGELSAWVAPLARTFKELHPKSYITVFLVPCQYASGNEADVATRLEGVDHVIQASDSLKSLFFLKTIEKKAALGAVMYLGGDPFYTQLMSLRTGFSAYGYTEHKRSLGFFFKQTFFKHQDGDLMQVNCQQFSKKKEDILEQYGLPDKDFSLFFPGSRKSHFDAFFALCMDGIERLLADPTFQADIIVNIPPFISDQQLEKALSLREMKAHSRLHFIRGKSQELMSISSCLVSLPGTNTAEALYMNLPMITMCPLNKPELLILDGLAGLMIRIPLLGKVIHRLIIKIARKKVRFVSLANKIANKAIVPEYIGVVTGAIIHEHVIAAFSDPNFFENCKKEYAPFRQETTIHLDICKRIRP